MLKEPVLKILNKIYEPNSMVEVKFKRYDLAIKTDEQGRAVFLFMGQKGADGKIRGERYARRLVENKDGVMVKDHWELKGPATS